MDRIDQLEALARTLEPGTEERAALLESARAYGDRFLTLLPDLPGRVDDDEAAAAALPYPIVKEDADATDVTLEALWESVDRVGVNEAAGHFFGFIPGPALHTSAVADYMAAVTNRYTGVAYASPGIVRLQRHLLDWLGSHFGYPAGSGGDFTSGGSIGNLTSIVTARDTSGAQPADFPKLVAYLTDHTHHSVQKALRIAGVGTAVTRHIPVDDHYRMKVDTLFDQIASDRAAGLRPWLLVASAGTTDTGAVDPLQEIGAIAEAEDIWFHVDAAYGGAFGLCEPGRRRLAGIELSDSMVMDPHKGLFVPFGTGVVLVKDREAMVRSHAYSASYMQDAAGAVVSPADVSPELTRPNRVLRVWLPLRLHGVAAFRAALEEKLLLASILHEGLSAIPEIEVGPEPDLSVVTFRCRGKDGDVDAATRRLHEALIADGRAWMSSTVIGDVFTLRMAVLNIRTHREHIHRALEAIGELAPKAA